MWGLEVDYCASQLYLKLDDLNACTRARARTHTHKHTHTHTHTLTPRAVETLTMCARVCVFASVSVCVCGLWCAAVAAMSLQLCPTLCDPIAY